MTVFSDFSRGAILLNSPPCMLSETGVYTIVNYGVSRNPWPLYFLVPWLTLREKLSNIIIDIRIQLYLAPSQEDAAVSTPFFLYSNKQSKQHLSLCLAYEFSFFFDERQWRHLELLQILKSTEHSMFKNNGTTQPIHILKRIVIIITYC